MFREGNYRKLDKSEEEVGEEYCFICKATFQYYTKYLDKHLSAHLDDGSASLSHCGIKLENLEDLRQHQKYHMKLKTAQCARCFKKFPHDATLLLHLQLHENQQQTDKKRQTLFICQTCGARLGSRNNLKNHIEEVHDKVRPFKCQVCDKEFFAKAKLKRHETTHEKVRPHICELCGKAFKLREALGKHMMVHNGTVERRFQCSYCGKKLTDRTHLQVSSTCENRVQLIISFLHFRCTSQHTPKLSLINVNTAIELMLQKLISLNI